MEDIIDEKAPEPEPTPPEEPTPSVEEKKPLRDSLVERSRMIRELFNQHMKALNHPTTIAEIAKTIDANRVTVAKYIAQSMKDGNPYNLGVRKVGMYEIIWKKLPEEDTEVEA